MGAARRGDLHLSFVVFCRLLYGATLKLRPHVTHNGKNREKVKFLNSMLCVLCGGTRDLYEHITFEAASAWPRAQVAYSKRLLFFFPCAMGIRMFFALK